VKEPVSNIVPMEFDNSDDTDDNFNDIIAQNNTAIDVNRSDVPHVRRSTRVPKMPDKFNDFVVNNK
jgi:hypothetical protein